MTGGPFAAPLDAGVVDGQCDEEARAEAGEQRRRQAAAVGGEQHEPRSPAKAAAEQAQVRDAARPARVPRGVRIGAPGAIDISPRRRPWRRGRTKGPARAWPASYDRGKARPARVPHRSRYPVLSLWTAMCRNIRPLFNFDPPATDDEIRAAALQFVRKVSGFSGRRRRTRPPSIARSTRWRSRPGCCSARWSPTRRAAAAKKKPAAPGSGR